jgi:peptide/nickel transport system permease protein
VGNYLLKRLLLMIPTLVGISLVVFVIMVAAPGRPGEKAQSFGEQNPSADPTKEKSQGESQRLFRRQFALDRPVFWNYYPWLGRADVQAAVKTASEPVEASSVKAKREAKERLEDWGYFAVPSLVEILRTPGLAPQEQSDALYWLRTNATRLAVQPYGRTLDEATLRQNDEWIAENARLAKWGWRRDDPPERRAEVIGLWSAWYEENKARWPTGTASRLVTGLFDTQFATYWNNLLHFDFGISHVHKRPVLTLIGERLPITILLSGLATLIAYFLAIPLGILSAVRPYTRTDRVMTVTLFLLYSLPSFFIGTVVLQALTIGQPWKWFPNSGWRGEGAFGLDTWAQLRDVLWHITLPLVVSTYGGLAALSRYARTGMLDVVRSDYVRTARAKGLSEGTVILRHAARNGMMPVVTLLGGILPSLIGGSVFVEYVFNIQGMGLLTIEAITSRDYNIIMAESLIVAVLTLVGILISDLLYAAMDPRISFK